MGVSFWDTIRGNALAETLIRELPKLTDILRHDYTGYTINTKVFAGNNLDFQYGLEFINAHKKDIIKVEHLYRDCSDQNVTTVVTYKEKG